MLIPCTGGIHGAYILRTLGSIEFNYENAKSHLINLDLDSLRRRTMHFNTVAGDGAEGGADVDDERHARLMQLATWINLDSRFSVGSGFPPFDTKHFTYRSKVGCAGAVLSDIQRRKAAEYLSNDPDAKFAFRIRYIEMFTLRDSLFVNVDTLTSLQILGSENHPNSMNQGPEKSKQGAKEGLSLYGLFHVLTHTAQGKTKLRQMFLRPSTDLEVIQERQQSISVLLRPENGADIDIIGKLLRKIKNIKHNLLQLKKGVNSGRVSIERGTWASLQAFCAFTAELREAVQKLHGAEGLSITARVGSQ